MQLNSKQILRIMDYREILESPSKYVDQFTRLDEFEFSLYSCSELDLKEFLKIAESHELYEHCVIIRDVLKQIE